MTIESVEQKHGNEESREIGKLYTLGTTSDYPRIQGCSQFTQQATSWFRIKGDARPQNPARISR